MRDRDYRQEPSVCYDHNPEPIDRISSTRTGSVALDPSLSYLIGLLGELQTRDVDLYLHRQALDTGTPSGRMLFGMLGVFSERLGRSRTTPFQIGRIRAALDEGRGVRETARLLNVSAAKVSEIRHMMPASSTAPSF